MTSPLAPAEAAVSCRLDTSHVAKRDPVVQPQTPARPVQRARRNWRSSLAWWLDPRNWLRSILALDDTPHAIALGTAIGVLISVTPTGGFQMLLVLAVAMLARPFFRFNQVAGLIAVYLSNPVTTLPIYWLDYRVGALLLQSHVSQQDFARMFQSQGLSQWWNTFTELCLTLGMPLLVGSLVVGAVAGLVTYPLVYWIVERVQHRRRIETANALASSVPR